MAPSALTPPLPALAPCPLYQKFTEFLGKIRDGGGEDTCEDVHGGLHETLNLSWREMKGNKARATRAMPNRRRVPSCC